MRDVDNGGVYACVKAGGIYLTLWTPQFCCKPKTALKKLKVLTKEVLEGLRVYADSSSVHRDCVFGRPRLPMETVNRWVGAGLLALSPVSLPGCSCSSSSSLSY